jgi:hypothetical protein
VDPTRNQGFRAVAPAHLTSWASARFFEATLTFAAVNLADIFCFRQIVPERFRVRINFTGTIYCRTLPQSVQSIWGERTKLYSTPG